MKKKSSLVSTLLLLLFASALVAASYPEYFIVLSQSSGLRRTKSQGQDQLSYSLPVKFPAGSTISEISSRLEKLGWVPQKEDLLNPGSRTSNYPDLPEGQPVSKETALVLSWGWFLDSTTTPETYVYNWNGQWKNKRGDIMMYVLMYRDVFDQQYHEPSTPHKIRLKSKTLHVHAIFTTADLAKNMQESSKEFLQNSIE